MRILAIYDNPKFVDRYTIVTDETYKDQNGKTLNEMLGVGADPRGFSQWSSGTRPCTINGLLSDRCHLGNRIRFEDLSETVQKHIAERIFIDG